MRALAVLIALTYLSLVPLYQAMAISPLEASMIVFYDQDTDSSQSFVIDTEKKLCEQDGDNVDEPFAETTIMRLSITNNLSVRSVLESFTLLVRRPGFGRVIKSKKISTGDVIDAKSKKTINLPFASASDSDSTKVFVGSEQELQPQGHHRVIVRLNFRDGRGDKWSLRRKISIIFAEVNRCPLT